MKRRVVITGLGVVSPIGIGKEEFWKNLIKGKSGVRKITLFDTSKFKRHYAAEVKNFNPSQFIDKRKLKFLGRSSQLSIVATILALKDANINFKDVNGVLIGTTMAEHQQVEVLLKEWFKGDKKIEKNRVVLSPASNLSANTAQSLKIKGLNMLIPTACSAGNYTISYGFDLIKKGDADCIIVGGADALSFIAFSGFQRLYAMAPKVCQPFDKNRKGMILGEGAGVLVLESLEKALKRKAKIYAEILGYGLSCDAYHMTIPHYKGIEKAIKKALDSANVSPEDIDYICAHGTGTIQNDKAECKAIKNVFGRRYKKIPVSSIKSMIGHCMGAASSIEAVACCLAIENGVIPPTINFQTPDPECDIDCVPNKSRKANLRIVLNNGFAFGGNNCCVVLGKLS